MSLLYTADEVAAWVPPAHPACGLNDQVVADWVIVAMAGQDRDTLYLLNLLDCVRCKNSETLKGGNS